MFPSIKFRKRIIDEDLLCALIFMAIICLVIFSMVFFIVIQPTLNKDSQNAYWAKRYTYKKGQVVHCNEVANPSLETTFWTTCTINFRVDYTHYDNTYKGIDGNTYTTSTATRNIRP